MAYARGYCQTHYRRVLSSGDAREDEPIRIVTGAGWLSHGYWYVPVDEPVAMVRRRWGSIDS